VDEAFDFKLLHINCKGLLYATSIDFGLHLVF